MPLYVYECEKCNLEVEVLEKVKHYAPDCKRCGREMKKKIVASAAKAFPGAASWRND
jgi:putative FmdB family regulatory protein